MTPKKTVERDDSVHEELILPPAKLARVRNDVDRYGCSDVIAQRLGMKKAPRSFGAWRHGWIWFTVENPEELGYGLSPRDMPIIVRADSERDMLLRRGFRSVVVGGLPFAYVEKANQRRKPGSIVAFPPHSLSYGDRIVVDEQYLDYIASIKRDFSDVYCCLYWDDFKNPQAVEACEKRGIKVVAGARPDDMNSLRRMRVIFDYFDCVTTSTMGSHVLYGAYCGSRVSMSGPYYPHSKEAIERDSYVSQFPGYAERIFAAYDKSWLMAQFPWLFVDHPMQAVRMDDWARDVIGADNLLDDATIMEILGWSPEARLKAISRGILRRTKRYLGDGIAGCRNVFHGR